MLKESGMFFISNFLKKISIGTVNPKVEEYISPEQSDFYYHGTSRNNAYEIFRSATWRVLSSSDYRIWFSNNFFGATDFANGSDDKGAVVVVRVTIDLTFMYYSSSGNHFCYEIPASSRNNNFCRISGIVPIRVLSGDGTRC